MCHMWWRGEFLPWASARHCLTFPQGFIALPGFSHGVFFRPDVWDPVDGKLLMQRLYHGKLPTPPRFRFMVILPFFSTEGEFRWTLQYYFILQGQLLFPSLSCFGCTVFSAGWGSFAVFHWTLQCFHCRANYFHSCIVICDRARS